MAATKKSAKRSSTKKRPQAKRQSPKKKSAARKGAATGRSKMTTIPGAAGLKRQARKGLKAARGGLGSVLQAGEKTWKTLKNTTAQVVEGVKETFVGEPRPVSRRPRSR